MAKENRRALIISRDIDRYSTWLNILNSANWRVSRVDTRQRALKIISSDPPPTLMFLDIEPDEHVKDIEEGFAQLCRESGMSVIPILTNPTPEDVVDSFRRGANDVLIEPFDGAEMQNAITRIGSFRDLYRENKIYQLQLESANRELNDSLNTLKMDQLAGREVQLSILPNEPLVYGDYEVFHNIVPSLYLSGDFVGYNMLLDRFLVFWMADVSGHGASSAFVTVMLSFMIRQISRRYTGSDDDTKSMLRAPEGLCENINRHILGMDVDKHLTFFVGSIDTQTSVLRYATAAQLPMPVMVSDSETLFLTGKGKPLGLFEDVVWPVKELVLPDNFSLTIASDGLLDCLTGDSIATQEQTMLEACGRAEMDHDSICTALKIGDIKAAPDDASLLTVVRRQSGD